MKDKKYDIAVYGAGIASIFLINKLSKLNLNIILIEKGNLNKSIIFDTIDNFSPPFDYNKNNNPERVGSFFGTASLWSKKGCGGKFQMFDQMDIHDKWPIDYSLLNKKYNEVIGDISKVYPIEDDFLHNENIGEFEKLKKYFQIKNQSGSLILNFKKIIEHFKKKILNKKNITTLFDNEIVDLNFSFNEKKINYSICKNKNGEEMKIYSKIHILNLGCIENNRFLLNIFEKNIEYLKKLNFGKKIMFHPSISLGNYNIVNKDLSYLTNKVDFKKKIKVFKIKNYKKKNILINTGINFEFFEKGFKIKALNFINYFKKIEKIGVSFMAEHLPTENSYAYLSNKIDKNGLKKISIKSHITEENSNEIFNQFEIYKSILEKTDIGNSKFKKSDFYINFETGNHHHGGLEFSDNQNTPTNKDMTLKNFNNLFIGGSSIFPNSSIYGPTLTIIACSYILYDNILKKFNLSKL